MKKQYNDSDFRQNGTMVILLSDFILFLFFLKAVRCAASANLANESSLLKLMVSLFLTPCSLSFLVRVESTFQASDRSRHRSSKKARIPTTEPTVLLGALKSSAQTVFLAVLLVKAASLKEE